MREQTHAALTHPEWVNGRRLWRDGAVNDIIRRIHHGDPTRGWEGDPRLEVYFDGDTRQWELWRLEHDNTYRRVVYSDPGGQLDTSIIDWLVAHDTRRGYDPHRELVATNTDVKRRRSDTFHEWVREELGPHASFLARKGRLE
jgi:hypothetical protein